MKKFFSKVFISFCIICSAFGFIGCKSDKDPNAAFKNLPDYSCQTPVVPNTSENNYTFTSLYTGGDSINGLISFCENELYELSKKRYYVLDAHSKLAPDKINPSYVKILKNETDNIYHVYEYIYLFDENLKDQSFATHNHLTKYHIILKYISTPVDEKPTGDLKLEFGFYSGVEDTFINIYIGNVCIGTCYCIVATNLYLNWYYNAFNKLLFYGNND